MPVRTFLTLLFTVIAAAGGSVGLFWLLGINIMWLGLAAIVLTLLIRLARW